MNTVQKQIDQLRYYGDEDGLKWHAANTLESMQARVELLEGAVDAAEHCLQYYGQRGNWSDEKATIVQSKVEQQYSYGWYGSGSDAPWDWPTKEAKALAAL